MLCVFVLFLINAIRLLSKTHETLSLCAGGAAAPPARHGHPTRGGEPTSSRQAPAAAAADTVSTHSHPHLNPRVHQQQQQQRQQQRKQQRRRWWSWWWWWRWHQRGPSATAVSRRGHFGRSFATFPVPPPRAQSPQGPLLAMDTPVKPGTVAHRLPAAQPRRALALILALFLLLILLLPLVVLLLLVHFVVVVFAAEVRRRGVLLRQVV